MKHVCLLVGKINSTSSRLSEPYLSLPILNNICTSVKCTTTYCCHDSKLYGFMV